jgi:hypothetical protein
MYEVCLCVKYIFNTIAITMVVGGGGGGGVIIIIIIVLIHSC